MPPQGTVCHILSTLDEELGMMSCLASFNAIFEALIKGDVLAGIRVTLDPYWLSLVGHVAILGSDTGTLPPMDGTLSCLFGCMASRLYGP